MVEIPKRIERLGELAENLMTTDIEKNKPCDRGLSARLYGRDQGMRKRQFILTEK